MKIEVIHAKKRVFYSKEKNPIPVKRITIKHLPVNHHKPQIAHSVCTTYKQIFQLIWVSPKNDETYLTLMTWAIYNGRYPSFPLPCLFPLKNVCDAIKNMAQTAGHQQNNKVH